MNRKILISALISIFLMFVIIGPVSANYYSDYSYDDYDYSYDYAGPWIGTEFYDIDSYYRKDLDSNQIIIEFTGDLNPYVEVYVPERDLSLVNNIYICIFDQLYNSNSNINTLNNELTNMCQDYGIDNPNIEFKSPYGDNSFIYIGKAKGISMEPTIEDGSVLILNKTRDIHVGDIVSAEYHPRNYDILKRVSIIDGDEVYLISDNVNGTYVKNGKVYQYEGLRTWVNMSDINGVLIDSYCDDNHNEKYYGDVIEL